MRRLVVLASASAAGTCLCCLLSCAAGGPPSSTQADRIRYGKPRLLCTLEHRKVDESSGLTAGRRSRGVFWTHNDSGDKPRLFAFNIKGKHLGTFDVTGARNRDWEDLASFSTGGKHYLVVCDTGDNDRQHAFATLYFVEEPLVDANGPARDGRLKVAQTIQLTYADGPQDTEAVAVDSTTKTVYLISKRGKRTVYELPIPERAATAALVAKPVATLNHTPVVAMDISPDGLRAVVLTYFRAHEYVRSPGESWAAAFRRPDRTLPTPGRQQGESICYGPDGRTLYLTSEKLPTPLLEVPALPEAPRP